MVKAYDVKELGLAIKAKAEGEGLALAEDAIEALAKACYLGMKDWLKASALLSESKVDDFVAPFYDQLDTFVLPQIDKIDLNKDGK